MTAVAADFDTPQAKAIGPQRAPRLKVGRLLAHLGLLVFVVLWTLPTVGLLISSVRDPDQLAVSGWWTALVSSTRLDAARLPQASKQTQESDAWVISGNLLGADANKVRIDAFGITNADASKHPAGSSVDMRDGGVITVQANGDYVWKSPTQFTYTGAPRIYYQVSSPPRFTLENYRNVLTSEGIGQSFINSLTVAIPATVIPIMIAAFAAYALAWMRFPYRSFIVAAIVGLLVVPLQMSLIPVLSLYTTVAKIVGGEAKGYIGVWLAHTAFGLPLAIYLLRNYMAGLPREIMESARIDGASHFKTFTSMVLPLSFPALASFAIFQFLWIWNDLLVAIVFLGAQQDRVVLTGRLVTLLGTRGEHWELLTAAAFVSIVVPLTVFFALQRYFVRGLLAGSVK
jgi:alpha-glucoside transport system permease protein